MGLLFLIFRGTVLSLKCEQMKHIVVPCAEEENEEKIGDMFSHFHSKNGIYRKLKIMGDHFSSSCYRC